MKKSYSHSILACSALALMSCSDAGYAPKGKVPAESKAKKIIFIMTDTHRWDMMSSIIPDIKTPNLDALASEGVRFDKAYTVSPVSGPARSSIFTGMYPHTNASWGNDMPIADDIKTVGQRLSDHGYHCAYMGKWHLDGTDYFGNGISPDGWDPEYFYDMRMYLDELTPEERVISRKPETNRTGIDESFTYGNRVANRAIKFLDEYGKKDDAFFLAVSFDEPHHPFLCPEPYASMYNDYVWPKNPSHYDDLKTKPEYQQMWAEGRQFEDKDNMEIKFPYFFGSLSYIDYEIGRIMAKVNELCPDALIIYTSDHGDFLNAHSLKAKGPCVYDDVARVPFIVRWPGKSPENVVSQTPISLISVTPTIMDAAGVPVPDVVEGKSILTTLTNPDQKPADPVFMEFGRFEVDHDGFGAFQPLRAIFDGRYKLSINLMSTDELYDLENDPYEVNNLINDPQLAEVRTALHNQILEQMNQTRDPFRGVYWHDRAWRKDFTPTWEYTEVTRSRKDCGYYPRSMDYNTGLDVSDYFRKKEQDKKN
ncbi:MAG: sulfatase-like hydrolase/transferase [Bacteroidales bacterium]